MNIYEERVTIRYWGHCDNYVMFVFNATGNQQFHS